MMMGIWILQGITVCTLAWMWIRERQRRRFVKTQGEQRCSLIHLLEEGIALLSKSYEVQECNRGFTRILGAAQHTLLGKDFFAIEKVAHEQVLEKCFALLKQAQIAPARESFSCLRGGESCVLDITAAAVGSQGFVLVIKDSSHDYQVFKMGKDFIANASHELRTPITIIKGFVETLQELPEVSEAMLEDIFEKILRSCTRMDDIVKNLLLLTDLDHSFKTNIQPVDMISLLDNCRHALVEIYPEVQVTLSSSQKESKHEVDSSLLELAIMNLLQNAVKYSPAPARIEIALKEGAEEYQISIIDHGYGIPYENRPHIFNRFYSVNKTISRKLGGAGLGLSIVKNIVEKHHGSISVEDNHRGGTVFTLSLPNS